MKKHLLLATFVAFSLSNAYAQDSNVSIYGLFDVGVRYSTNQNAKGDHKLGMEEGPQSGSRLGFRGIEDLGGGTKAFFTLESGFSPVNGTLQQGGRMFGRQSLVGLQNPVYGKLTLGRQITLGAEMQIYTDIYSTGNSYEIVGTQLGLTGLRWDNAVRYANKWNNLSGAVMIAKDGSTKPGQKALGTLLSYDFGKMAVYGFYQDVNDTADGVSGTKAGIDQKMFGLGATYQLEKTKLMAAYYDSHFSKIEQDNKIFVIGAINEFSSNIRLKANFAYEKQDNIINSSGNRYTASALASYLLSKRTELYVQTDYTRVTEKYTNAVFNFNNVNNPNKTRTNVFLGMKHTF